MISLKYRQYGINYETQELVLEKRYTLPLIIVRLSLFLVPESVLRNVLRKLADDFRGKIEGITLKQFIRMLIEICNEIAEAKNTNQNCIIYDDKEKQQKYVILVE